MLLLLLTIMTAGKKKQIRKLQSDASAGVVIDNDGNKNKSLSTEPSTIPPDSTTSDKTCSWRTRHLRLRAMGLRELHQRGEVTVSFCPGNLQLADILTKSLGHQILEKLRELIGLRSMAVITLISLPDVAAGDDGVEQEAWWYNFAYYVVIGWIDFVQFMVWLVGTAYEWFGYFADYLDYVFNYHYNYTTGSYERRIGLDYAQGP
jgi:hypothetical protein